MISRVHLWRDRKETTLLCILKGAKELKKEKERSEEVPLQLKGRIWAMKRCAPVFHLRVSPFSFFSFFFILLSFQSSFPLAKWQNRETCRFFSFFPPPSSVFQQKRNKKKRGEELGSVSPEKTKERENKTRGRRLFFFFFWVPPPD